MRDVDQCALLYLGVALRSPVRQAPRVQLRMPGKSGVYGVDDEVEEIGLICRVAVGAGEDHPVRAAGSKHLSTGSPEVGKEMAPGATVSRRFASHQASIHCLVVAGLNGQIKLRVDLRLEDR